MKKHLPTLLKTCVTLALLIVIFRAIHPREILQRVTQASPGWMAAALLLSPLLPLLTAIKWHVLLRRAGVHARVRSLLGIVIMTGFIGTFLPSNLGVDALRMYALHRKKINLAANAGSLLCERLLGVLALVGFALVAVVPAWRTLGDPTVLVQVAVLSACIVVLILALLSKGCFEWGQHLARRTVAVCLPADSRYHAVRGANRLASRGINGLSQIHETLRLQMSHPWTVGPAAVLALSVQLLRIVRIHMLFRGLDTCVPWSQELTFVPIILLLSLLPISVLGIGIKEGAFVYFFSQVGVAPAVALAVSFYTYVLQLTSIVPGSIIYLYERRQARLEAAQTGEGGAGSSALPGG